MDPIKEENRMSPHEVSRAVGVTTATLRNWRHLRKHIRYTRAGNRVFYEVQDVDEFIARYHRTVEVLDD